VSAYYYGVEVFKAELDVCLYMCPHTATYVCSYYYCIGVEAFKAEKDVWAFIDLLGEEGKKIELFIEP
jgi:hypothetical protein